MSADSAPPGLGERGRALWEALASEVAADWEQRELLVEACRIADRLDELEVEARSLGPVVTGSRGQPVRNPLVDQQTALQGTFSRLLRKLTAARETRPVVPLIEAPARLLRFDPADWGGDTPAAREALHRARLAFIDAAEGPTTLGDFIDVMRLEMWERGHVFPRGQGRPVPWEWYLPTPEEYRADQALSRKRRAAAEGKRATGGALGPRRDGSDGG